MSEGGADKKRQVEKRMDDTLNDESGHALGYTEICQKNHTLCPCDVTFHYLQSVLHSRVYVKFPQAPEPYQ